MIASAADLQTGPPNPEVVERARRRQFTAAYKLRTLREADACEPGQLGALLRREGLYSSHLTHWRGQRDRGLLAASPQGVGGVRPGRPASRSWRGCAKRTSGSWAHRGRAKN